MSSHSWLVSYVLLYIVLFVTANTKRSRRLGLTPEQETRSWLIISFCFVAHYMSSHSWLVSCVLLRIAGDSFVTHHIFLLCGSLYISSFVTRVLCLVMYCVVRDGIQIKRSCWFCHHSWAGNLFVTHHIFLFVADNIFLFMTRGMWIVMCRVIRDSWCDLSFVTHDMSSHSWLTTRHVCPLIRDSQHVVYRGIRDSFCVFSFVTHMSSNSWLMICLLIRDS